MSYCAIEVDFSSTADVENYPEFKTFASRNTVFGENDPELQEMHDFLQEESVANRTVHPYQRRLEAFRTSVKIGTVGTCGELWGVETWRFF